MLVFFSRKRSSWPDISIDVDGVKITPSLSVHYLGFFVDENLKWKEQLKAKCESRIQKVEMAEMLDSKIPISENVLFFRCSKDKKLP